jgi:hypothetical protein
MVDPFSEADHSFVNQHIPLSVPKLILPSVSSDIQYPLANDSCETDSNVSHTSISSTL